MLKTVIERGEALRKASNDFDAASARVRQLKASLDDALNIEFELQQVVERELTALAGEVAKANPPPAPPAPPRR